MTKRITLTKKPKSSKIKLVKSKIKSSPSYLTNFMYYPDLNDEEFYTNIWSKKEFYETKSDAHKYYEDPNKKKELLMQICGSQILKLIVFLFFAMFNNLIREFLK